MSTNVSRHGMARAEPTGWVGWLIFAGVTAIMLGAFQILEGLVAVFKDSYYVVGANNLLVHVNYDTWGWTHFGIGVAVLLAGIGVLTGSMWGRVLGIAVAVISAVVNLAFIGAYPLWGVIIIALDIVMIYALAVHGREMKMTREGM
jgi:hypothetical protein